MARRKRRSEWIAEAVEAKMRGQTPPKIPDEWRYLNGIVDRKIIGFTVAPLVNGMLDEKQCLVTDQVNGKYGVVVRRCPYDLARGLRMIRALQVLKSRAFRRRKDARAYAEKLWNRYAEKQRAREASKAQRLVDQAQRQAARKLEAEKLRNSAAFKLRHAEEMQKKAATRSKRAETLLRKWTKEVRRLRKLAERERSV